MIRVLTMMVALAFASSASLAADYKIYMALWKGCEEACDGFQDYMKESMKKSGHNVEFLVRSADRNPDRLKGFIAEARSEKVDLILTWGTSVSRGVAGTLKQLEDPSFPHEIPVVFTVVADPVGAGLVESLDVTGRTNVTGTFNRVPESVNIETIRSYFPGFRHLGLVWNSNEANSALKHKELAALAVEMGYKFTAVELPIHSDGKPKVDDIAPAVAELATAGVDFIYLGSSSFLDVNRDVYTSAAVDNGIPVLSPYERLVRKSQALISIAASYYDTGRLAAVQAEKILLKDAKPGDVPVARMTDFAFVINMTTAKKLGLFPPIELLQIAETVE